MAISSVPRVKSSASLTAEGIKSYFLKHHKQWPSGEKVRPVQQEGAAHAVFLSKVLKMSGADYERYWLAHGSAPLNAKGALRVEMLREDREDECEFLTISWWDSMERMAPDGGDPSLTHHLPRDREFLIESPRRVRILRLLDARGA